MGIVKKDVNGNLVRCLINSSNLLETVYNTETKGLIITFKGGRVYEYKNVNPKVYNEFEQSTSHGKSFYQLFKSAPTTRLKDIDPTILLTELASKS